MQPSIVPYQPEYQPYFYQFNRAWISKFFTMEPVDETMLSAPEEHIIAKGGEIWFAKAENDIVGAYALLARADGNFEFSKLGVADQAKGHGIARKLLHHAFARAKSRGAQKISILSNSALKTACQLYRDEGFIDIESSEEDRKRYARVDTFLERTLDDITSHRAASA